MKLTQRNWYFCYDNEVFEPMPPDPTFGFYLYIETNQTNSMISSFPFAINKNCYIIKILKGEN